jgi:thiol-disulfide isomerase/thioredoxin
MKIRYMLLLLAIGLAPFVSKGQHSYPQNKISADSMWNSLPKPPSGEELRANYSKYLKEKEIYRKKYRELGLKFWYQFPKDQRRYEWLDKTVAFPVAYWINPEEGAALGAKGAYGPTPVDEKAIKEWNNIYPKMRAEYLSDPKALNDKVGNSIIRSKGLFKRNEFYGFLESQLNAGYRKGKKLDLQKVKEMFLPVVKEYYSPGNEEKDYNCYPFRIIEMVYEMHTIFGLSFKDLEAFTKSIAEAEQKEPLDTLRKWVEKHENRLALTQVPFELKHNTVTGDAFDLKALKGKVVLIDMWATWCTVCIARMPAVKKVHDKYKDQGFEVISVCINPDSEADMTEIHAVEKKIGANWPLLVIGGKREHNYSLSLGGQIMNKYGFGGVPQLLLLDKNGLLVEINGALQDGNLEALVKEQLSK